jgi:hypothetical protein
MPIFRHGDQQMLSYLKKYWPALVPVAALIAILDAAISSAITCHPPTSQTGSSEKFQECTALMGPVLLTLEWLVDFIDKHGAGVTAAFTAMLAVFTYRLWWSTNKLWEVTRIAAEHIPHVERAYISGGGRIEANGLRFRFDMNNYGKTAGNIIEIRWGFCVADAVPPRPSYGEPHFYFDWIKPDAWIKGFYFAEVPTDTKNLAIYGRYYYRDVFNKSHSSGFILSFKPDGDTMPIRAPAVYTREQDEADPDESLSYRTNADVQSDQ